ncbi:MAG: glycerophosphodiester phosphodiesterase family protein [Acidimicrobiia bacterium]
MIRPIVTDRLPPVAWRKSAVGAALLVAVTACAPTQPGEMIDVPEPGSKVNIPYDLQGHRGARGLRPENTLPAVEAALDAGVSTVELDLHFSSDRRVVAWHDPKIDPSKCGVDPSASLPVPDPDVLATGSVELMVSRLTVAELAGYRCDRNPDPTSFPDQTVTNSGLAGDRYGIVEVGQIFDFVDAYARAETTAAALGERAGRVEFNLELKRRPDHPGYIDDTFDGISPGAFELALLEEIDARDLRDRVVVQSFDHRSLWALGSIAPDIRLSVLTRRGDPTDFERWVDQGASIWSPDWREVDSATLAAAHRAGLKVIPWTVNDSELMDNLITLGVDGIITDRPDLAPAGRR